jgi:hypothetical protein
MARVMLLDPSELTMGFIYDSIFSENAALLRHEKRLHEFVAGVCRDLLALYPTDLQVRSQCIPHALCDNFRATSCNSATPHYRRDGSRLSFFGLQQRK